MKLALKNGKIATKSDAPKGLRAVECGCCNPGPCGGCPTLRDLIPGKPTSLNFTFNSSSGRNAFVQEINFEPSCSDNYISAILWGLEGCNTGVGFSLNMWLGDGIYYNDPDCYYFYNYGSGGVSAVNSSNGCGLSIRIDLYNASDGSSTWHVGRAIIPFISPENLFGTHSLDFTVYDAFDCWDAFGGWDGTNDNDPYSDNTDRCIPSFSSGTLSITLTIS